MNVKTSPTPPTRTSSQSCVDEAPLYVPSFLDTGEASSVNVKTSPTPPTTASPDSRDLPDIEEANESKDTKPLKSCLKRAAAAEEDVEVLDQRTCCSVVLLPLYHTYIYVK